jgi:hypothetical protein
MFKHFLFILVCAMNCTLIGGEMSQSIQSFSQITIKTHPAVKYVLDFLEAQKQKDIEAFAHCFGQDEDHPIFVNLPGGIIMRDPKQLIERHRKFYESSIFHVDYGEFYDGIGNDDFFSCSVLVNVTLPDGSERTNYIDMMYVKQDEKPVWIPIRLINTVLSTTR